MKDIAVSILGKENIVNLINDLITKGISQVHYDVMDGKFVENKTDDINEVLKIISQTNQHISDVHLMTASPLNQINKLDGKVDYITFHYEAVDPNKIDKYIKNKKSKIGVSIKPDTPIDVLKNIIDKISHVLVMSVYPGKGGQEFIEDSLERIKKIKIMNPNILIQVDGGINNITAPLARKAGADSLVSGSYLLNNLENGSIEKLK